MVKRLLILVALLSCVACKDSGELIVADPAVGTSIDIALTAWVPEGADYSWTLGDRFSMYVTDTISNSNNNLCFSAVSKGESAIFGGDIYTWDGDSAIVCAIYPYLSGGYSVGTRREGIVIDNSSQVIDGAEENPYANGILVAGYDRAVATSTSNYNFRELQFEQVLSVFAITVYDITMGEEISSVTLSCADSIFFESAEISVLDGDIIEGTTVDVFELTASVENHTETLLTLNFPLIPFDASSKRITITLQGLENEYTTSLSTGYNFTKATITELALDFQNDLQLITPTE